ncbi:MAG: 3-isopropylmalate dehydratase large subunit [Actinomycetota bacterium]|nr:3-isopropylmalate dehydratase large subunit [Actinomycetota bacterium]
MNITEKIIAAHAGRDKVTPGELVSVKIDLALANDITAPGAILEFAKIGVGQVFDKDKVVIVPDHFTPNKDIASAEQAKMVREFAGAQDLTNYFEIGQMGIEHALLPELGLVLPGDLVIGADSHTCTYGGMGAFSTGMGSTDLAAAFATGETWLKVPSSLKFNLEGTLGSWVTGKDIILYIIGKIGVDGALYKAMEFTGGAISALSMDSRFSICNMAIEAGGKNGIIAADATTRAYVAERSDRPYTVFESDADAVYEQVLEFRAEDIELQVAFPHLPSNARGLSDVGEVAVDQVVIGSCTNGRIEDLRIAAKILKGQKVHRGLRLIVIPATQKIYKQAMNEGLFDIFIDAGAAISTPTCGPCLGGHMGVLAAGERALATTNRNFVGRMGHKDSEVYLAGPAVAAATAIAGKIVGPEAS